MNDQEKKSRIDTGYEEAFKIAKRHYENFPVVSFFLPSNIRKGTSIIYWFARTADDYADEGVIDSSERIKNLELFEERLTYLLSHESENYLESALRNTIISQNLTHANFFKLLKAFKQDVTKKRYSNFNEVRDYCSCSADPVGRIMLELLNIRNEKAFYLSDKICTALQLTNFIQDSALDFEKGRIYYPKDEMDQFGVTESVFEMKKNNLNFKKLVEFSVDRIQSFFDEGKGLLEFLSGRFRYEIDWTIKGGEKILQKIRGSDFDVFNKRPLLTKSDHFKILIKTFFRQ
jgi:squalene synthase HpnC